MSLHGNRNPETEVGTRDWDVTVIGLIMFLFGEMWTLVLWVTKAVGCFKYCWMGHTSRNVEDDGADNDLNCLGFEQDVSEEIFYYYYYFTRTNPSSPSLPSSRSSHFPHTPPTLCSSVMVRPPPWIVNGFCHIATWRQDQGPPPEEKNFSTLPRNCSCDILVKNVVAFVLV